MRFHPTPLRDTWLVDPERVRDGRGFFARTFCVREFAANGLVTNYPQHSMSFSGRRGTLRGMHFQFEPYGEVKLVRCVSGAIWDVIIDMRPDSPTFRRWYGVELSDQSGRQFYIPHGFAHGFQTLTDNVQVNYLISEPYAPDAASGVRYDDPSFEIAWPLPVTTISEKDLLWPNFVPGQP
jgi:dTDP-4-dehydrorhamnose 3,5-epimerase